MNNCCSQCLRIATYIYGRGINNPYCADSNCPCHKPTDKAGVFICKTGESTPEVFDWEKEFDEELTGENPEEILLLSKYSLY